VRVTISLERSGSEKKRGHQAVTAAGSRPDSSHGPLRKERKLGFAAGEVKYTKGWDRAMTEREWFGER